MATVFVVVEACVEIGMFPVKGDAEKHRDALLIERAIRAPSGPSEAHLSIVEREGEHHPLWSQSP